MLIFDKFIGILAPHRCILCRAEGFTVCPSCSYAELSAHVPDCFLCARASRDFATCTSCRRSTPIKTLLSATYLDDRSKKIIYELKFGRNISVAREIARIINDFLPRLPEDTVITYVPTSSVRIRNRGYDHSRLIAKELAKLRKLEFRKTLIKTNQTRQVGASKKQRKIQANDSYQAISKNVDQRPIVIVDDIATTGATLETCTKILKKAGYKDVGCLVFARE